MAILLKDSERLILGLNRLKITKDWLSRDLNISRPTLDRRIRDNNFTDMELDRIKGLKLI